MNINTLKAKKEMLLKLVAECDLALLELEIKPKEKKIAIKKGEF